MITFDGNGLDAEIGDAPTTITNTPNAPAKAKRPRAKAAKPKAAKATKAAKPVKAKAAKVKSTKARAAKASPKKPKKAREANPATLDAYGLRKGSIKSKAAALYARPDGATLAEVKKALGSVQYNVIKQLKERGFKIKSKEEVNKKTGRNTNRFFLAAK